MAQLLWGVSHSHWEMFAISPHRAWNKGNPLGFYWKVYSFVSSDLRQLFIYLFIYLSIYLREWPNRQTNFRSVSSWSKIWPRVPPPFICPLFVVQPPLLQIKYVLHSEIRTTARNGQLICFSYRDSKSKFSVRAFCTMNFLASSVLSKGLALARLLPCLWDVGEFFWWKLTSLERKKFLFFRTDIQTPHLSPCNID